MTHKDDSHNPNFSRCAESPSLGKLGECVKVYLTEDDYLAWLHLAAKLDRKPAELGRDVFSIVMHGMTMGERLEKHRAELYNTQGLNKSLSRFRP